MEMRKKRYPLLLDIVELYIPGIAFLALFISFILQIVSRYIFRNPLVWPYELSQFAYLWVILLGTCYASRTDGNIVFSIVYEAASPKIRRVFDIISDSLTVLLFGLTIPATIQFYRFYMTRRSPVFNFPLGIVYAAFAPFLLITIGRSLMRLAKRFKKTEAGKDSKEAEA